MKVRSRHNSKKQQKKITQVVVIALGVLVVGLLLPRLMTMVVATVMYPIHVTHVWLTESSSFFPTLFRDRTSLVDQIESLENELVVAKRASITQQRLYEENVRLRALVGDEEDSRIMAAIIARPAQLPYDLLQIDRGTDDGVEVGAPVFAGSDIVVGLVVHAAAQYSFVELFTTPGFEATAFISGPNVTATLEGYGGGVARVRVPQGIPIREGDLVYIPSVEPGVFGRIAYLENGPTQPEQYGYITPDLAINSLYWVAVGSVSQIARSTEEIEQSIIDIVEGSLKNSEVPLNFADIATTTASSSAGN